MKPFEWIFENLKKCDLDHLYLINHEYERFLEETESKATHSSYRVMVNKIVREFDHYAAVLSETDEKEKRYENLSEKVENSIYVDPEIKRSSDTSNDLEITTKSLNIQTLDDLIEAAGVDTSIWRVESWSSNSWEVTMKLSKENGDEVETFTNFQVRAKFERISKLPVVLEPVAPIRISPPEFRAIKKESTSDNDTRVAMVISDAQFSFEKDIKDGSLTPVHDRGVLDLFVQVATDVKPDIIVINGDMFDLPDFSDKFLTSPEMRNCFQPSLLEFGWWFLHFLPVELTPVVPNYYYLEGNHEFRIRRALMTNLSAAYGLKRIDSMDDHDLVSIPYLLGLKENEWEWIGDYPHEELWLNSDTKIVHSDQTSVDKVLRETFYNLVIGHVHRSFVRTKNITVPPQYGGGEKSIQVASFGTSATPSRVPRSKHTTNWQNGFGVIEYTEDACSMHPIIVENDSCIYGGSKYWARDQLPAIQEDLSKYGWRY